MTVRINKPALNLREELTKAQGVVRYEQRQFWMDGLVENGTFDSDTSGWTIKEGDGTFTSSSGQAVLSYGTGATAFQQDVSVVIGKKYTILVQYVGGTSSIAQVYYKDATDITVGTVSPPNASTLSVTFTAQTSIIKIFVRVATAGTAIFDNIKLFEVDANDNVIHSVPLGFKPVHVYEDGLLQREGENHDYTVVDTGFEYQIKPTVAPSATTETCVIAEREL